LRLPGDSARGSMSNVADSGPDREANEKRLFCGRVGEEGRDHA
jgi:hypothetical protein